MLKRYAIFVSMVRSVGDILVIGCIWIGVFYLRFHCGIFAVTKGIPDFNRHLILTVPVIAICYLGCLMTGLYKPRHMQNLYVQIADNFKAAIGCGLLVLAFFYYIQDAPYTRMLQAMFIIMLFAGLTFSHLMTAAIMQRLHAKGYCLRYYAVIGAGPRGRQLVRDIERMGWLGLKCAFFVDNEPAEANAECPQIPVYSPPEKLMDLIAGRKIDEVYLALSGNAAQQVYPILESLQAAGITIRIIPDWGNLASISGATVMTIGSQVLFSAGDSPLSGVNLLFKELFDRVAALLLLALMAIPMLIIALLVKTTSKGPVFYRQVRVGMDQQEFEILKFRTMADNAEQDQGPQWAKQDDPRRTAVGAFLRTRSLDELPQLINVLKGQMSLVGPRPERPVFAKQFSDEYKKYMLRLKVKAGMTGWAQIHGFRGDTSLRKRLLYDLYYVRNWSWALDMWILLRTPRHIVKGENAH